MGTGSQHHVLEALPAGKTRYPLYSGKGGPQGAENLVHTEIPSPDCPARIESLYRLSYLGPRQNKMVSNITRV